MVDYEWLNLILYINDTGIQYKVFKNMLILLAFHSLPPKFLTSILFSPWKTILKGLTVLYRFYL